MLKRSLMKAAKRKILPLLWLLIALFQLLFAAQLASAKSAFVPENRVWKIFPLAAESHQPNIAQVAEPQRERAPPQRSTVPGCVLGPESETPSIGSLTPNGAVVVTSDGSSVWGLNNFARGQTIQQGLGMNNLPWNYPVVDDFNWDTGVATSLKSLDLNAASYQDPTILANRLNTYIGGEKGVASIHYITLSVEWTRFCLSAFSIRETWRWRERSFGVRTETANGNAHSPQRLAEKKPLQSGSLAAMLLAADEDGG
jgi:hypothetical protein